jgi:hypothetical protein
MVQAETTRAQASCVMFADLQFPAGTTDKRGRDLPSPRLKP